MDGFSLRNELYGVLQEDPNTSIFVNQRLTWDLLYRAAVEFQKRTNALTSTQSIPTVANQTRYPLNADYLQLWATNSKNEYFIKYNDGSADYFITHRDFDKILYGNQTTAVPVPGSFSLTDTATLTAPINSSATAIGTVTNGESTLTDSTAPFASVSVGDEVHNTTASKDGIVIGVPSTSALLTCMFDSNSAPTGWANADSYVLVPQGRKDLVLDPPPLASGNTMTVYYVCKPAPVYSVYRTYRFDEQYRTALVLCAAWLYKYRDREPNFGDRFYLYFDGSARRAAKEMNRSVNRTSWKVNLQKRSYGDRSYR